MSDSTSTAIRLAGAAVLGLGSLLARSASAQPNPFEDYERFIASEPAQVAPATPGPALRTAPMTWSLGLRSQVSFSRLTYQREAGQNDGAATALLFRLSPALEVFVHDRILIGLSPGLMVRAGGNNIGDDAGDANMLIEASVHYFAPLSQRFSFVPGAGVGGYFGSGTRTTDAAIPDGSAVRVNRDTDTAGMSLSLYMGIAYQIDEHLQLRSGLSANAFFGWDSVQGRKEPLRTTATHVGIPIELFYVF